MAYDKVIDSAQLDADLTAVANAIRTKGGTNEPLAFPAGFVSAVAGIQAGGGGGMETGEITLGTVANFAIPVSAKKTHLLLCVPNISTMMANNTLNYCRVLYAEEGSGQVQAHSNKTTAATTMNGAAYWSSVTSDYVPVFTSSEIRISMHTAGIGAGTYQWYAW